MKILKASIAALALTALASTAHAGDQGEAYINLGANLAKLDTGAGFDIDFTTISGKIGYNFTDYLGFEVQGDIGVDGEFGADLDHLIGGFAVVRVPAGENFELFARGGVFTAKVSGGGASASDEDFAVGAGGQMFFTEKDGIRIEYTNLAFEDAHVFGASYVRKF